MNLPRTKGERKLRVVMLVSSENWNVPLPYNAPFRRVLGYRNWTESPPRRHTLKRSFLLPLQCNRPKWVENRG